MGLHSALNSHPFSFGAWSFAHNGTLRGFPQLSAELADETDPDLQRQRLGQTDSEQIFFWLLSRMRRLTGAAECPQPAFDSMMELLCEAVRELDERSNPLRGRRVTRLNFVLTNGRELYATRLRNSLYLMRQEGNWQCEICGRNHTRGIEYADYHAVTVASEPISRRPWRPVRDASLVGIDAALDVQIRPI